MLLTPAAATRFNATPRRGVIRSAFPSLAKLLLAAALAFALAQVAGASVVIHLALNRLDTQNGVPVEAGTLLQLINLGPDGIFNEIDLTDSLNTGLERWVSGDDRVISLPYQVTVGDEILPGDFASTAAFDLSHSAFAESTSGKVNRLFEFEFGALGLPDNTKIGVRWFPGLLAADYELIGDNLLQLGQFYGQFTRILNPAHAGALWISGPDGSYLDFDALVTADLVPFPENADPAVAGDAVFRILLPEPASFALVALSAAVFALPRHRRVRAR